MARAPAGISLLVLLYSWPGAGLHPPGGETDKAFAIPRQPVAAIPPAAPRPPASPQAAPQAAVAAVAPPPTPVAKVAAPRYGDIVEQAAQRYGVSARLIHAVIATESSYRSDAVSKKGAVGLMQLMPATALQYGATDLRDPTENIHAGTRHLRELLEAFNHDVSLALAAYNAGAGAVKRHGGIPPYPETQNYVRAVLSKAEAYR